VGVWVGVGVGVGVGVCVGVWVGVGVGVWVWVGVGLGVDMQFVCTCFCVCAGVSAFMRVVVSAGVCRCMRAFMNLLNALLKLYIVSTSIRNKVGFSQIRHLCRLWFHQTCSCQDFCK